MVDHLEFRYVHRPPNRESNSLHNCQSNTIANDNFYLKKRSRGRGSIMMFSCSKIM